MKIRIGQIILCFSFLLLVSSQCQTGWAYIYTLSGAQDNLQLNQYSELTGEFIQTLQKPPHQYSNFVFAGPNDYIYSVTQNPGPGGAITRYNAITGEFVDNFTSEIWGPGRQTMFGPDGNIYSRGNYERLMPTPASFIHKINGNTGTVIQQQFVSFPSSSPSSYFTFSPDGNILVGLSTGISMYSGTTGALLGQLPLPGCDYLTMGPGNNLFGVQNSQIMKYEFYDTGYGPGWKAPVFFADTYGFMRFGPDGNLYVANSALGKLAKYDGQTGAYVKDMFSFSGDNLTFDFAGGVPVVTPEPVSSALMLLGGGAMVFSRSRRKDNV